MTDTLEQVWVIPNDPNDLAPLPAMVDGKSRFAYYNRKQKRFGDLVLSLDIAYETFEHCRAAMIKARTAAYDEARAHAGVLARSIEHIRNIPTQEFPDVVSKVPEAEQQKPEEEKAEGQKEVIELANGSTIALVASEDPSPLKSAVKPALKRPSRKS